MKIRQYIEGSRWFSQDWRVWEKRDWGWKFLGFLMYLMRNLMSGECYDCGEHCLECRCMNEIKIWAQMFFEDGSVTQALRIYADWLEDIYAWKIDEVADLLMKSANREEGWLLLWGAGNMVFNHYPTSFSKEHL